MTNYEDYEVPLNQEALIEDFSADFAAAIDSLSYENRMSEVQFDFPQEIQDEFDKVIVKDSAIIKRNVYTSGVSVPICEVYRTLEIYVGNIDLLQTYFEKFLEGGLENSNEVDLKLLAKFSAEMVDKVYHAGKHERLMVELKLAKRILGCEMGSELDWHYDVRRNSVEECSENKNYLSSIALKGPGTVFYEGDQAFEKITNRKYNANNIKDSEIKYGTRGAIYNFNVLHDAKFHSAPIVKSLGETRVTLFIGNAEFLS